MSNVRKDDREETEFTVIEKAKELSNHTELIIQNPKVFKSNGRIDDELITLVYTTALKIYTEAWLANNVRVTSKRTYLKRNLHQREAIEQVILLEALVDKCRKKFHLRNKKYIYWVNLVVTTRKLISGWKASDDERYKGFRK